MVQKMKETKYFSRCIEKLTDFSSILIMIVGFSLMSVDLGQGIFLLVIGGLVFIFRG